jgi:SAM-dependent methyltransferase
MKAPEKIPDELLSDYLMGGTIALRHQYIDQASDDKQEELVNEHYTPEAFSQLVEKARRRESNHYGLTDQWLYKALDDIRGKDLRCLVVGSTIPWYEAILVSYGFKDIIISEYAERPNFTDKCRYIYPYELEDESYDLAISISSHEHCGLGRYGDPLDPNGDLLAIAELKGVLKKKGILMLAVPVGMDTLVWNAHRIYGRKRLPQLIEGWNLVDFIGFQETFIDIDRGIDGSYQPLMVLKNEST